jgi:aminoglycoside phosphotransferase (APT) family kinase protein
LGIYDLPETSRIEEGLQRLFRELHDKDDIEVKEVRDITVGWEARIYSFILIKGNDSTKMVARVYNGVNSSVRAEREFDVMNSLRRAGYPAAEVYVYCGDSDFIGAPFIVMEMFTGGSMMDKFMAVNPEKWNAFLPEFSSLYAQLHKISPRKTIPWKRSYRSTKGRIRARIKELEFEAKDAEITVLQEVFSWLKKRLLEVENMPLSIIHQDFHPGNIMYRADGSAGVIDWSGVDIGDPREDLSWTKVLASSHFDSALGDAFTAGYQTATGWKITNLEYFEALSILRRLGDYLRVVASGAEKSGMRSEIMEIMKSNRSHYLRLLERLHELTGIETKQIEATFR